MTTIAQFIRDSMNGEYISVRDFILNNRSGWTFTQEQVWLAIIDLENARFIHYGSINPVVNGLAKEGLIEKVVSRQEEGAERTLWGRPCDTWRIV